MLIRHDQLSECYIKLHNYNNINLTSSNFILALIYWLLDIIRHDHINMNMMRHNINFVANYTQRVHPHIKSSRGPRQNHVDK